MYSLQKYISWTRKEQTVENFQKTWKKNIIQVAQTDFNSSHKSNTEGEGSFKYSITPKKLHLWKHYTDY